MRPHLVQPNSGQATQRALTSLRGRPVLASKQHQDTATGLPPTRPQITSLVVSSLLFLLVFGSKLAVCGDIQQQQRQQEPNEGPREKPQTAPQIEQAVPFALDQLAANRTSAAVRVSLNRHPHDSLAPNSSANPDAWRLLAANEDDHARISIDLKRVVAFLEDEGAELASLATFATPTPMPTMTPTTMKPSSRSNSSLSPTIEQRDSLVISNVTNSSSPLPLGSIELGPQAHQSARSAELELLLLGAARPIENSLRTLQITRPKVLGHNSISTSGAPMTPPPIRLALEVMAENYTAKKIAEEANMFAMRLINQLNIEKLGAQGTLLAPFAVYQGLTLLLSGAMGETARELDRVLLGSQSVYENIRLTHDPDRTRLLASLADVIGQLQWNSAQHEQSDATSWWQQIDSRGLKGQQPPSLASAQHQLVANNLLFAPSAYEISAEFRATLAAHYNNTALTKVEVGSTESVQEVNMWIRAVTGGLVPALLERRATFDEFHVMTLLCTSWLAQEWTDTFERVDWALRGPVRLKSQGTGAAGSLTRQLANRVAGLSAPTRPEVLAAPNAGDSSDSLLEFIDDDRQSHFVEYIISRPTRNIHHYHLTMNGFKVDMVVVPFYQSNHRLIVLTPLSLVNGVFSSSINPAGTTASGADNPRGSPLHETANTETATSNLLSKFLAALASNPRRAVRTLWNIVAPELLTKQTLNHIQSSRNRNITIGDISIESPTPPPVRLSMPIFRAESDSSLEAALNHIGIVNSFDANQANFIGINGHPFNTFKLHLSNVVSRSSFNLNERGINYDKTIQSLETMRIYPVSMKQHQKQQTSEKIENTMEMPKQEDRDVSMRQERVVDDVKLNRPFLYLIGDVKTRLLLYTGTLRDPSARKT